MTISITTSNENERKRIDNEIDVFFASLSEKQKEEVCKAVNEDFKEIHKEIDDIKQTINVRNVLAPVLPTISVSYLAKNYFHKTPQWFYQRMNGNIINGKSVRFTTNEIKTLSNALQDISKQLSAIKF